MKRKKAFQPIAFFLCLLLMAGYLVLPVKAEGKWNAKRYELSSSEPVGGEIIRLYNPSDEYKQNKNVDKTGGSMGYGGHYAEVFFGPSLFSVPSTQLCMQSVTDRNTANFNMAMLAGSLSSTAYHDGYLVQAYKDLGCAEGDIFLYSYPDSSYNRKNAIKDGKKFANDDSLSFSIASREMMIEGEATDILFITLRGTHNFYEIIRDRTMKLNQTFNGYYSWDWIYEFQDDVFAGLEDYKEEHPDLGSRPMKIFVTGHSLAGGGANLVGAKFTLNCDSEEWYADAVTQDDIYCYTFGGLDSISGEKEGTPEYHKEIPALNGFDNIINIYNMLDNFGPEGKLYGFNVLGSQQVYGKFGHFYTFRDSMDDYIQDSSWQQHEIAGYLEAVENGLIDDIYAEDRIRVRIRGSVNVQIFRGETRVGEIKDNNPLMYDANLEASFSDGMVTMIVPTDTGYKVKMTATGEEPVSYIIERVSSNRPLSIVYDNIKTQPGKIMETEIPEVLTQGDIAFYVLNEFGEQIALVKRDGTEISLIEEAKEVPSEAKEPNPKKDNKTSDESKKNRILLVFSCVAGTLGLAGITTAVVAMIRHKKKDKNQS